MKRLLFTLLFCLSAIFALGAKDGEVRGPQGAIAYKISLPEGFNPERDRCPMVLLMHGVFSNKDLSAMPSYAKALAEAGIASIRFDFDGHGKSEGQMQDMTVEKEIADALAIYEYVKGLPYVTEIGFLGHSQGGVVASMAAGRLAEKGQAPKSMVLLAPGAVIKETCQSGKFFFTRFDPKDPPAFIRCFGFYKLGREYLLTTQNLDIYGTAAPYKGKVCILHGDKDIIVPLWCSERYQELYGAQSDLTILEGEGHKFSRHPKEAIRRIVEFFRESL